MFARSSADFLSIKCMSTPPQFKHFPLKIVVGGLLSFWNGRFFGDMLSFSGVFVLSLGKKRCFQRSHWYKSINQHLWHHLSATKEPPIHATLPVKNLSKCWWVHSLFLPWKTLENERMEPENHLFEKETHLPSTSIVFHDHFQGCISSSSTYS